MIVLGPTLMVSGPEAVPDVTPVPCTVTVATLEVTVGVAVVVAAKA